MYSPQNAAAQPNNAQKRQSGDVQSKSGGGGPPAASSGGFLKNQINNFLQDNGNSSGNSFRMPRPTGH